jgi:hypothetical protein
MIQCLIGLKIQRWTLLGKAAPPGPMNILGFNCHGLRLDAAVGELRDLVRSYNPVVVFLFETKKKSRDMEMIR